MKRFAVEIAFDQASSFRLPTAKVVKRSANAGDNTVVLIVQSETDIRPSARKVPGILLIEPLPHRRKSKASTL